MAQLDVAAKLGKLLQIVYSEGVRNQISEDFRDWEAVSKLKVSDEAARSLGCTCDDAAGQEDDIR